MKQALNRLMKLAETKDFDRELDRLHQKFKDDPKAIAEIHDFIRAGVSESGKRIDNIAVKIQLAGLSEIVSLSYISRKYFGRSRYWLSQRINAHKINGKPAYFTEEEIATFNSALKDIGRKIGSFSVHR